MSSTRLNRRKPLAWLLGLALAGAFFGSGAFTALALGGDGNNSEDRPAKAAEPTGGSDEGRGMASVPAMYGPGERGGADAIYPACRTPLPAGVITASGVDLAKAGFVPGFPTSGFSGLSISVSSNGECDSTGSAGNGQLGLESAWKHDASGLDAYISQYTRPERTANVMREDSATFWSGGYQFTVVVNAYHISPAESGPAAQGAPASATGSGSGSGVTTGGAAPGREPAPMATDPRSQEVLAELIRQVAPDIDQKCFWTMADGGWDSLGVIGAGDPRPAVPDGFRLESIHATTFNPPGAGCDTSLRPTEGFSFSANFQKNADSADFAYLGVSVYGAPESDFPGQLSEWGANWTNGKLQFAVYAKAEEGVGVDVIRAIARLLDPSFDEKCFIHERRLEADELAGLGLHEAKAPAGWKVTRAELVATEIAAGCTKPEGWEPSYSLSWSFASGGDTIDAGANRYGGGRGDGTGYQSQNSLSWTGADGTNYHVSGSSRGVSPAVSKDALVAVAKSMDPGFDLSKLSESPEGKPVAMPGSAEGPVRR